MPLFELIIPVHSRDPIDGFALCTDEVLPIMDIADNDVEVTCAQCKIYIKED